MRKDLTIQLLDRNTTKYDAWIRQNKKSISHGQGKVITTAPAIKPGCFFGIGPVGLYRLEALLQVDVFIAGRQTSFTWCAFKMLLAA